jgi:hypothetical protein
MTPKQHYKKVMSRGKMAPIDMDKYPKRRGLEGPFRFKSGRIVYYDPKEGKYYDSETDMYLSDKETMKLQEDKSNMNYEVVTTRGRKVFSSLEDLLKAYDQDGVMNRSGARKELKGQPKLDGLMGPFWNGKKGGVAIIRYEDPGTFKSYSESREDALEGFVRYMEEGRKDGMDGSEEDIFTVLGPGTTLGEGGSERHFDWKSVNKAIDRLGDHMMAELGDAFEELDLHQNVDHQEAAEKMKEYLEATFNEVRDRVEMYETNAITRSKKAARRRR